ncbi:MAG: TerD family protein [Lachnospiraceae bacterium]|nr:TerD family protein [Lachnospiraceae bacterium]
MVNIPLKSGQSFDRNSLGSINHTSSCSAFTHQNLASLNRTSQNPQYSRAGQGNLALQQHSGTTNGTSGNTVSASYQNPGTAHSSSAPYQNPAVVNGCSTTQSSTAQNGSTTIINQRIPPLVKPISKGQKMTLCPCGQNSKLTACFGWNTTNAECDVDVSAFLLKENGKVVGDSWFVFYGQTASPDQSVRLNTTANMDRETISIDFTRLNQEVKKIVFVLTINEAFEKRLNFSMMKDAYVRILSGSGQSELVSFQMTEYYSNVISMMIGEIYQYKDSWKFNAIGNGVTRDLAGLCDLYGVETI